jgi:pyruvate dehydrogenase E2 component (dihydrolipoamide acetyltransferase)/2-oxoisovalerate dehydrogenase E2 component (dihydrolipoyl transacylase)
MDFRLPELGEGVYEAELVAWLVKVGDAVKRGRNLMEVLTDKASMEVPAPFAGTITQLQAEAGQQIKVGDVVLTYAPAGAVDAVDVEKNGPEFSGSAPVSSDHSVILSSSRSATVRAAPSVRQMARKLGIDLGQVRGTGPEGRILIGDLTERLTAQTDVPSAHVPSVAERPDFGKPGTRIKLQGVRRKVAEHMVLAKKTIPHYSYMDECDVTELVRLREALKPRFAREGIKLTFLPFIVKAVAAGLKEVPLVNSSLDEDAGEIVLHDRYHVGVAVAVPAGLIVPVVKDADHKSITEIAHDIERLTAEARTGKTRLEDLKGGTFSVTSVGNLGGLISTPVINHPQVGIMGVGKIVKRPVYDTTGNLHPADLVYLSFSFDHRVVDGAVAIAFGNVVIRSLNSPAELLLPDPP